MGVEGQESNSFDAVVLMYERDTTRIYICASNKIIFGYLTTFFNIVFEIHTKVYIFNKKALQQKQFYEVSGFNEYFLNMEFNDFNINRCFKCGKHTLEHFVIYCWMSRNEVVIHLKKNMLFLI